MSEVVAVARPLYRTALLKRRKELDRWSPGGASEIPAAGTLDAEEALRRCMVRYWPRIRSGNSPEDRQAYLACLFDLAQQAADPGDLRYFDAWNNAFEALSSPADPLGGAERQRFAAVYRALLDRHLQALGNF